MDGWRSAVPGAAPLAQGSYIATNTHTPSPIASEMAFLMSGTLTGQWEPKALLAHESFH